MRIICWTNASLYGLVLMAMWKLDRSAQLILINFASQLHFLRSTFAFKAAITDLLTISGAFTWGEYNAV